jgi:hypothetical protein
MMADMHEDRIPEEKAQGYSKSIDILAWYLSDKQAISKLNKSGFHNS